jgi:hypothetical protein
MLGMRWMHSIPIDGFHWHWCIGMEAIEVLHRRRVLWVLTILMPSSMVFKGLLVMMLVVHL